MLLIILDYIKQILTKYIFHPYQKHNLLPLYSNNKLHQEKENHQSSKSKTLLYGCHTYEEHLAKVQRTVRLIKGLHGAEGLYAAGFEYRKKHIQQHDVNTKNVANKNKDCNNDKLLSLMATAIGNTDDYGYNITREQCQKEHQLRENANVYETFCHHSATASEEHEQKEEEYYTKLYHIKSNTPISESNYKFYISDDCSMYDEIARLCSEYAQDLMLKAGMLEWITICNKVGEPPIRALVHNDHHLVERRDCNQQQEEYSKRKKPTLLIITGKGKTRAGVFSRRHLIQSSIEQGTALPMIKEAIERNMNITIIDPNARGQLQGMITVEKSLGTIFGYFEDEETSTGAGSSTTQQKHDLYILAHSQSGAQIVSYLLDRSAKYLPYIKAIAFMDSTHNIQWSKNRNLHQLTNLLQSEACIYIKKNPDDVKEISSDKNTGQSLKAAGDPFIIHINDNDRNEDTKKYKMGQHTSSWIQRFGNINTYWAGTSDHHLINFTAHSQIWNHFDNILGNDNEQQQQQQQQHHRECSNMLV